MQPKMLNKTNSKSAIRWTTIFNNKNKIQSKMFNTRIA